jgi:hypothetical protein
MLSLLLVLLVLLVSVVEHSVSQYYGSWSLRTTKHRISQLSRLKSYVLRTTPSSNIYY